MSPGIIWVALLTTDRLRNGSKAMRIDSCQKANDNLSNVFSKAGLPVLVMLIAVDNLEEFAIRNSSATAKMGGQGLTV